MNKKQTIKDLVKQIEDLEYIIKRNKEEHEYREASLKNSREKLVDRIKELNKEIRDELPNKS